jgi:hypothetical protein
MRAYEAGIKLAQAEFFGKYAFTGDFLDPHDYPTEEPAQSAEPEPEPAQAAEQEQGVDPANPEAYQNQELAAMEQQEQEAASAQAAAPAPEQGPAPNITPGDPTVEVTPPEYFEAQGGYGRMARNLRDMYQRNMDALYDIPEEQLSEDNFNAQMKEYEDLADISGKQLSQMYGNQALQAGDQLDLTDLQDRYRALANADQANPYTAQPVSVIRRGKERQLRAEQARASRKSPPAQAPAQAAAPAAAQAPAQAAAQAPAQAAAPAAAQAPAQAPVAAPAQPARSARPARPESYVSPFTQNLFNQRANILQNIGGQVLRPQDNAAIGRINSQLPAARRQDFTRGLDPRVGNPGFKPFKPLDFTRGLYPRVGNPRFPGQPSSAQSPAKSPRFGTFRTTDGKGGTTVTTLNGMTQAEGKKQMSEMKARQGQPFRLGATSAFKDLDF